jgi:tripartite-type tricarboxylate transporter receptor subunit TctC
MSTTKEATGHKRRKGVWRGFAAPRGLPKEIATQDETAINKINVSLFGGSV